MPFILVHLLLTADFSACPTEQGEGEWPFLALLAGNTSTHCFLADWGDSLEQTRPQGPCSSLVSAWSLPIFLHTSPSVLVPTDGFFPHFFPQNKRETRALCAWRRATWHAAGSRG